MSFFITTAINYVNAEPHMGHAYEAITTDVIARHMRQRREDVFFLTGTDEHGEPVADAAAAQGLDPKVLGFLDFYGDERVVFSITPQGVGEPEVKLLDLSDAKLIWEQKPYAAM